MGFTNSKLVNYTKISPNKTENRNHAIDTITIHCAVGQVSVQTLGEIFAPESRKASSNYGIGYDGSIGMYVEEKDRSWCTSSASNDHRAITIEVACDPTAPYAVNGKAYASLVNLLVDICERNHIKKLKWRADKSLIGQVSKQNMTVHRWFSATECPGEYLYNRMGVIAAEVNKQLSVKNTSNASKADESKSYMVKVTASALNVRKGPGMNYDIVERIRDKGVYTIVDESTGKGSDKGWGKLKSGAGWISLDYVNKI